MTRLWRPRRATPGSEAAGSTAFSEHSGRGRRRVTVLLAAAAAVMLVSVVAFVYQSRPGAAGPVAFGDVPDGHRRGQDDSRCRMAASSA